jgi:hypothetical protein
LCGFRPRLQRRVRGGIAPPSLLVRLAANTDHRTDSLFKLRGQCGGA